MGMPLVPELLLPKRHLGPFCSEKLSLGFRDGWAGQEQGGGYWRTWGCGRGLSVGAKDLAGLRAVAHGKP